jgi:hypothetical protein
MEEEENEQTHTIRLGVERCGEEEEDEEEENWI